MRKAADFAIQGRAQWLMNGAILNPEISKSAKLKLSEFEESNVGQHFLALDNETFVCYTLCQFKNSLPHCSALRNIQINRRSPE